MNIEMVLILLIVSLIFYTICLAATNIFLGIFFLLSFITTCVLCSLLLNGILYDKCNYKDEEKKFESTSSTEDTKPSNLDIFIETLNKKIKQQEQKDDS